jgi:hypothetical protein
MRRTRVLWLPAILLTVPLVAPAGAHAQRGARSASSASLSGHRNSTIVNSAPVRTSRRSSVSAANGFYSSPLGNLSFFPTYGLGINGINTIATQNIGVEAAIDPATQWSLVTASRVARITRGSFSNGGFYLLDGGGAYALPAEPADYDQPPPQQQPQVIVVQQAAPPQGPPTTEAPSAAPALPDVGQFTLVLHDGKQIEAVAFTQTKDRIVYVTRDGSRRTIALSDLDAAATVRLNQERGTPLQLPL